MRKLRISHLTVQPVLVWDDGEELAPGPQVNPISTTLSGLPELASALTAEIARLEAGLTSTTDPESDPS